MSKKTGQKQQDEKQAVDLLQQFVAGLRTLTLTYDAQGQAVSIAASDLSTSNALRATKVVLTNVTFQIDALLLAAVEKEAKRSNREEGG